jgi:hypothetical protein
VNLLPFVTNPATRQPKRYQVVTPARKIGTDKRGKATNAYRADLLKNKPGYYAIFDTTAQKFLSETTR